MNWILTRALLALLVVGGGTLGGWWVGRLVDLPLLSESVGAAVSALLLVLTDTLRGTRLLGWLLRKGEGPAPFARGLWGEVAHRTERLLRRADAEVRRERHQLQRFLAAIDASPNGVLLLDAHEQIDWCNGAAAEHFGLDPRRDRLQRITNLVRVPAFVDHLQSADPSAAVRFHSPDGARLLTVLVRDYSEGRRLVLSQDITERERAEEMRRHFVANVSHEIRTPLTVLAGFLETLGTLKLSATETDRVLGLMSQQTRRMQDLVSDLLTLAQLEGSPRPSTERDVDLAALIERVATEGRALSAGRHALELGELPRGWCLAGAESELHSAVTNLVSNAVRYTPAGGQIHLGWQGLPDGGGVLTVRDTGIGIAREHLPRLTERFYRVDRSRARETGGTGLGLSIVKHVVQRHGGELDIQSQPGQGSTFRLRFPARRLRRRAEGEASSTALS